MISSILIWNCSKPRDQRAKHCLVQVQYRELELRRDFNLSKVMTVGEPRRSDANKMKVKCQREGAEKRASTNNLLAES